VRKIVPLARADSSRLGGPVRSSKILVVDDFERFRRLIVSMLQERAEFRITEASDGLQAVQKAEQQQPDLILLDIALPILNGMMVARRVRKLAPTAKILFLSQEDSPAVVREALGLGALGYVHKARSHSDLLPAIDAVLQGKPFVSSGLEFKQGSDAPAPRRHEILFCSDEAAILQGLTRFIAQALNEGDAAIVLVSESHRDSLLQRLYLQEVDVDGAIQRGTYLSLDADKPPDPVRVLEAVQGLREAASAAGKDYPRVAVCGERAGRLWSEGRTDEAMRLEQLCNELARSQDIDILCTYPLPRGQQDDPALKSIRAEHSAVSFR
jgi:DNA-binding NarL/FixJ family response regulator